MKVELNVISGPHEGRSFEFDGHDTFFVGRGSQAHFRLPRKDPYFSRLHFMVEVNPPLCRLTDLDSTNGTRVNRRRVQSIDLQDGDLISGGDTKIHVRVRSAAIRQTHRQLTVADAEAAVSSQVPEQQPAGSVTATAADLEQPSADARTIGPFALVREIGRGGMGVVSLAVDQRNQQHVALKTIRPDVSITQRDVELFLREARVLESLQHNRIVRFIEMGEDHGQLYFAMEYLQAPDAATLNRSRGPLSIPEAVEIACQTLEALEYAHSERFIHRDIKPENLLVAQSPDGLPDVSVTDFGLARVYETSRMSGITMHGEIGGSLAFAPPEHLTDYRHATPAGDLYSVGATLYNLLTGTFVYDFPESIAQAVLTILQSDPVPIDARRPELPVELVEIVHRSLSRSPEQRFESAQSMRESLERYRPHTSAAGR